MSSEKIEDKPDASDDFFTSMLDDDVVPLTSKGTFRAETTQKQTPGMAERRKAAQRDESLHANALATGDEIKQLDPFGILSFTRPGVQHGVFKNLRLGKYDIHSALDLHGKTVEQSRQAVWGFIKDCYKQGVRCGLITHGKGQGREEPAKLKSCVNHWLPQIESVLAFHSAQKQHGGLGATYILFKKSSASRQRTSEQHQHRGKRS
ncbi:MAG: DNA endonuclease SmrA [Porticoccaceae bacterium]|nr:DNA endonuclease SmrA [Porticoccaceae bacterium]